MNDNQLLSKADYQRIYEVIYSVLEASGIATTHRACIFFATAGAMILRQHYKLDATIAAGTMALMVDEASATVLVYGRQQNGEWTYDEDGFHAWVQCDGWLIDFMAPIMGIAFEEDGATLKVPRRMLQKPLSEAMSDPRAIQHEGEFFREHDPLVAEAVLDAQPAQFSDLVHICVTWYRRPPQALPPLGMAATDLSARPLVLRAPDFDGAW